VLKRSRRFVAFSILLLSVSPIAHAQGEPEQSQGQQPAASQPSPKQPAPPLFPRHRRGTYKNLEGVEVVDATPQSPPLETDDPGVPDKGEWEINLSTFADLARAEKQVDLLFVDANYGLLPTIGGHELPTQFKVEFPIAAAKTSGDPFTYGVGAATLGLKFNFYTNEQLGLSMSVYPQVEFAPPGVRAVEKGLADPGQVLIFPFLIAKQLSEFTFVANAGIEQPVNAVDGDLRGVFSVGFGRAITRRVAAMMEIRDESAFAAGGSRLVFLNAGVMRGIHNVVLYTKLGHSLASSDGVSHTYVGVGMKLLIRPPQK
jgi:hypothetical protein